MAFLEDMMKIKHALTFCLLFLVASVPAHGQQVRLTAEVALARLCISEANWECFDTGDGVAIHEVISRGAAHQGISYTSYARSYARRLFGARPHDVPRLRWVGQLTPACTEPADWPTTVTRRRRDGTVEVRPHATWPTFRGRCLAVFSRAREVVAQLDQGGVDQWSQCERPVHDWGGWMDRPRAERLGLVEVDCDTTRTTTNEVGEAVEVRVETANDFYCRPGWDPGCVDADRE